VVGALHVVSTASVVWSVNEVTLSSIVISLSKILVHAIVIGPTRATWYVEIITVAQCINIHAPGQQYRATLPVNITGEQGHYIKQIKYIFCAPFVVFASVDVTVVSSLKRFKKSFSFVFYIL